MLREGEALALGYVETRQEDKQQPPNNYTSGTLAGA